MWNANAVKQVIGVTPTFFRPPCKLEVDGIDGDIDARTRAVVKSLGLTIVEWSYDSEDSASPDPTPEKVLMMFDIVTCLDCRQYEEIR